MKNILLLFSVLIGVTPEVAAQLSATAIKSQTEEIIGKRKNEKYEQDEKQKQSFENLLNRDVLEHYGLLRGSTEQKKYLFLKSPQYQEKLQELEKERDEFLSKTYHLDLEMAANEKYKSKYDPDTESFGTMLSYLPTDFYGEDFIQIGNFVFSKPKGILTRNVTKKGKLKADPPTIEHTISYVIPDNELAVKIERVLRNLRFLYVFSFDEPEKGIFHTRLDKVVAYNAFTGETYREYVNTTPSKKQKQATPSKSSSGSAPAKAAKAKKPASATKK